MEIEILRWSCKCPFAGKALTGNDADPAPEFSNPQLYQLCFPDTGKAFTGIGAGCFDLASNLLKTPGKPSLELAQDALTSQNKSY